MAATEADKRIGRAVAVLRASQTQQDVAAAMRLSGWKWSQSTVWSVETGERPLRLAEAEDLATILGTSVDMLRATETEAVIRRLGYECQQAFTELEQSALSFLVAAERLEFALERASSAGSPVPSELSDGGGWLDDGQLYAACDSAVQTFQTLSREAEDDKWFEVFQLVRRDP